MILGVLDVEDVTFAEPHLIKVVVHLIAQPRWSEDLSTALSTLRLPFQRFSDARLDDAGIHTRNLLNGNLVVAHITVTQDFIFVIGPNDVAPRCAIAQKNLKDGTRVLTSKGLYETRFG